MDSPTYLISRAIVHQNRPSIDTNLVRQNQAVVVAPSCLRNAVVEAQELGRVAHPSPPHRLPVRPFLHHYLDIIKSLPKLFRKRIKCLGHEAIEIIWVHTRRIIAPNCYTRQRLLSCLGYYPITTLTIFGYSKRTGLQSWPRCNAPQSPIATTPSFARRSISASP